jgi:hypothetical protein
VLQRDGDGLIFVSPRFLLVALFEVSKDVRALAGILFQNTVQALSSTFICWE